MKINGLARRVILLSAVGMGLAACAETQLAVHTAKRVAKVVQPRPFTVDEKKARKRTLRPYQIKGQWYYPKDDPDYDQTGIASWYGEPFHGRKTAIGEIYNMNAVSAAHKTLPLPSYVQVTNLDNGRVLRVRVNDRGPFVHGRIIDLSRRAAQLLGFERQGVAKVRVAVIGGENFVMASKEITPEESKGVQKAPQGRIAVETLPPPPGTKAASTVPAKVPAKTPAPSQDGNEVATGCEAKTGPEWDSHEVASREEARHIVRGTKRKIDAQKDHTLEARRAVQNTSQTSHCSSYRPSLFSVGCGQKSSEPGFRVPLGDRSLPQTPQIKT